MDAPGRLRILLIDADRAWLRLAAEVLQDRYEVATAATEQEAFPAERAWVPSLIIGDVAMPGLNALGLLQRLERDPALAAIPVLLTTANAALAERPMLGRNSSVKGYLLKHCSQRVLQEAVENALAASPEPNTPLPGSGPPPGAFRYRVLVTDDEPSFIQFVGLAAHRQDIEIHKAADGREALELARTIKPDLIISDMMMPGLTGIELMRELGKDERLKTIPCILTTSTKMKPKQVELLLQDFPSVRYVLPKPCSIEALRSALAGLLKPGRPAL